MPDSPDSIGENDDSNHSVQIHQDVIEAVLADRHQSDLEQEEAARLLKQKLRGAKQRFNRALSMQTRVLTMSASEQDNVETVATRLTRRHNKHLVTQFFVTNVAKVMKGENDNCMENLQRLDAYAKQEGFFLYRYDEKSMQNRLEAYFTWDGGNKKGKKTTKYIITEASGSQPDDESPLYGTHRPAADCQIHLPAPTATRSDDYPPAFSNPDKALGDVVHDDEWVEEARANPHSVARLDDIVTMKGMGGLGLAGQAMRLGMKHLVEVVNPERGKYPVKSVTGEIAILEGIVLPDGTEIMMEDIMQSPIRNGRSFEAFDFFETPHSNRFDPTYILKKRKYPVYLPGDKEESHHQIVVTWHVKVSRLKEPSSGE